MSEKKSITIDSNSLLGGGSSSSKRKSSKRSNGSGNGERKIRPSSIVQPSTLKKTLLERIKQHQRTRERSRAETETHSESEPISGGGGRSGNGIGDSSGGSGGITDNFSQSIDFLRKLAMKRRQLTQKNHRPHVAPSLSSSTNTPEAQILNTIAPTLQHGEILTNTGLLGLPVVPTLVTEQPSAAVSSMSISPVGPSISVGPMPMPMPIPAMPTIPTLPPETIVPDIPPKITDLAEMYNNTISATTPETLSSSSSSSSTNDNTTDSSKEPPLHIPQKPEDYLPSIFIKEEPPHGCLKNGKKPTFREWATKILGGGPPPHDGGAIGDAMSGGSGGAMSGGSGGAIGGGSSGAMSGGSGGGSGGAISGSAGDIDPSQIAGMRVKIRKTHKKRYRIGKHDNVVGVLLKNKQTQRHIQNQHLKLRQSSIGEIRKYLYDHHLLKIGSNAPPDVLRRMYEDAILTGDVKNTNDGVMLHNFMSGGSE